MRRLRRLGLAARLALAFGLVSAGILAALGAYVWDGAVDAVEDVATVPLRNRAEIARRVLAADVAAGTLDDAAAQAAVTAALSTPAPGSLVGLAVVGADGRTLAAAGPADTIDHAPAAAAMAGGLFEWTAFVSVPGGGRWAVVALRLVADPAAPALGRAPGAPFHGYVLATRPAADVDATLGELAAVLGSGVVLAAAAGILVAIVVTRLGLRPLRTMAAAADALAAGNLEARVPEPAADDEIGALARDFNRMAAHVEAAFARERAFVADAAHELRTPLAALRGHLELAGRVPPAEQPAVAAAVRRSLDRLAHLVDDLLALARLDARGPAALRTVDLDLALVAHDAVEEARALPSAASRTIELRADERVPMRGDPDALHRVLLNLLVNAVRHSPDGGRVELAVGAAGGEIRLTVRDEGPGIPADELEGVFDRFRRGGGEPPGDEPDAGSGLGLAIVRAIVRAHGGDVHGRNADPGAVLEVRLPGTG